MSHIKVKDIKYSTPENWENKHGIRVFFDHGESIFDEFANRNNRPVRDYARIIRERIVPRLSEEIDDSEDLAKCRIVPVPRQFPHLPFQWLPDWLPRTAYTLRFPPSRIAKRYDINFEVVVTVEDL